MNDKVKIIVTLNKGQYESLKNIQCGSIGARMIVNAVMNGIPLDENKGEYRPKGEWFKLYPDNDDINTYECGCCGMEFDLNDGTPEDNMFNFCPTCGAKMKGGAK